TRGAPPCEGGHARQCRDAPPRACPYPPEPLDQPGAPGESGSGPRRPFRILQVQARLFPPPGWLASTPDPDAAPGTKVPRPSESVLKRPPSAPDPPLP